MDVFIIDSVLLLRGAGKCGDIRYEGVMTVMTLVIKVMIVAEELRIKKLIWAFHISS